MVIPAADMPVDNTKTGPPRQSTLYIPARRVNIVWHSNRPVLVNTNPNNTATSAHFWNNNIPRVVGGHGIRFRGIGWLCFARRVSGTADDRWVFTEDNPGRELQVAAWLAGISRVLKGHNDTLAADCLEIARELFKITRCDNNWILTTKVHAAVELYLATKEAGYRDFVLQQQDFICKNIRQTGWFIGRFDQAVGNVRFSKAIRKALPELQAMYQEYSSKTPYGVPHDRGNRSSGSWEPQHLGYNYCYLHAAYPDLFAPDYIFNAVQYLLGMHPGRNQAAFVTGVGAETMKAAYGVNRADWSYIPGGVSPGTNLIRPDLPELLHFPFLWQEGEYCLGGHATWFMYMVLASQKILNGNEQ